MPVCTVRYLLSRILSDVENVAFLFSIMTIMLSRLNHSIGVIWIILTVAVCLATQCYRMDTSEANIIGKPV